MVVDGAWKELLSQLHSPPTCLAPWEISVAGGRKAKAKRGGHAAARESVARINAERHARGPEVEVASDVAGTETIQDSTPVGERISAAQDEGGDVATTTNVQSSTDASFSEVIPVAGTAARNLAPWDNPEAEEFPEEEDFQDEHLPVLPLAASAPRNVAPWDNPDAEDFPWGDPEEEEMFMQAPEDMPEEVPVSAPPELDEHTGQVGIPERSGPAGDRVLPKRRRLLRRCSSEVPEDVWRRFTPATIDNTCCLARTFACGRGG